MLYWDRLTVKFSQSHYTVCWDICPSNDLKTWNVNIWRISLTIVHLTTTQSLETPFCRPKFKDYFAALKKILWLISHCNGALWDTPTPPPPPHPSDTQGGRETVLNGGGQHTETCYKQLVLSAGVLIWPSNCWCRADREHEGAVRAEEPWGPLGRATVTQ